MRTCEFFPTTTVTLLTDTTTKIKLEHRNFQLHNFQLGRDYELIKDRLSHPKDFRHNFWFTSLARLYALCDYVIEKDFPVLHIESDVIISRDFPLPVFKLCDRSIAYTLVGPLSGVASVLWLANPKAALHLREFIDECSRKDPTTTDMKILGQYQAKHAKRVRVLASFPTANFNAYGLVPEQVIEDMIYTETLFNGYFDAADAGQYLLGDDPRNHRGVKYLRRELSTSYFKPSKSQFSYSSERKFVNINNSSINRFYSLHIHSKNQLIFDENRGDKILLRASKKQTAPEKHILVLPVLLNSIKISLARRLKKLLGLNE